MSRPKYIVLAAVCAGFSLLGAGSAPAPDSRVTLHSVRPQEEAPTATVQRYGITRDDVARIQSTVPNIRSAVPVREFRTEVRRTDRTADAKIIGTTDKIAGVMQIRMDRGRFLTDQDNSKRNNVAVIGAAIASKLFPGENAIGRSVRVDRHAFVIVGQLEESGDDEPLAAAIFVPISTMRSRFGDVVLKAERGAFQAESYELSRLELLLQNAGQEQQTRKVVEALLSRTHQRQDYRVTLVRNAPTPALPRNITQQNAPQQVVEAGTLESATAVTVANRLPGQSTILQIVPEGTVVRKGDVLVQLDNAEVKEKLAESQVMLIGAERDLIRAKAELESSKLQATALEQTHALQLELASLEKEQYFGPKGEHAVEAAALKRRIATAEATMQFGQQASAAAMQTGDATAAAQARLKITEAKNARDDARDALQLLEGPTRALKLKLFELQLGELKMESLRQKSAHKAEIAQLEATLAAAESHVKLASDRHKQLRQNVVASNVVSPIDGVVLYPTQSGARSARVQTLQSGATVRERQALVRVTDMKDLQVRVRVHESKIRKIRKGQKCVVVFDALPEESIDGEVRVVSTIPVPGTWPNTDVKEYEVVVRIERHDRLRIGMTCEARFEIK